MGGDAEIFDVDSKARGPSLRPRSSGGVEVFWVRDGQLMVAQVVPLREKHEHETTARTSPLSHGWERAARTSTEVGLALTAVGLDL